MIERKEDDSVKKLLKTKDIHPKDIPKKMKIQESNGQYSVKLPRRILEELGIEKGDFVLFNFNTEEGECKIKFEKK